MGGSVETGMLEGLVVSHSPNQERASLRATTPKEVHCRGELGEREELGIFTSHILLALEHNKGVATVGLLLLVRLFVGMRILDDTNLNTVSKLLLFSMRGRMSVRVR